MTRNRSWTLASRPEGPVSPANFALVDAPFERPSLGERELLVRNRLFAVAPTIRNWLNAPGQSYRGAIPLGGAITGLAGCEILASRHPDYPVGARIIAMSRWEDISVLSPDKAAVPVFAVPENMPFEIALGPLSPNSLTAYFGLIEVGRLIAGETVLVSGAAGSVGSVACQIARIHGCRVIAVAGGRDKCDWLKQTCGVDHAIDYRTENIAARLAELCPRGVNLVFDNVGGEFLQAAVDTIAVHGRIVLCGQISAYDRRGGAPGPRDMMKLVYGRVRMEGFVIGDFIDGIRAARETLAGWLAEGRLTVRVDLRHGLNQLPGALVDLFSGANQGTLLVANDAD
jgi:NADPH-dependent curcumin reductase CurA